MIYIGSDHRGYNLKERVKVWLKQWNYEFEDLGAFEFDPEDDYPDFAKLVAEKVRENLNQNKGIVICGSGVGVDIVANKFKGIRCGLAINKDQIKMAKADDDINFLALASDFIKEEEVKEIIKIFLETKFSDEERYIRRIRKISALEK